MRKFLTRQGRMIIYNSFILSNFNYCPLIWQFCGKYSTAKIEKIQERALRFVTEDYDSPTSDILVQSGGGGGVRGSDHHAQLE